MKDGCIECAQLIPRLQAATVLADGTLVLRKGKDYLIHNTQVNRDRIAYQYDGDMSVVESMLATPELINVPLVDIERVLGGVQWSD